MRNITVAIVYHSGYGHTARQAGADLLTAERLGRRVAEVALRLAAGEAALAV
jgi:hypothetical protein